VSESPARPSPARLPLWKRAAVLLLCLLATASVIPRHVAGRGARALFRGDLSEQDALARRVVRSVMQQEDLLFYRTGQSRFDGQSAIAIYQMTLLGLGQIVLDHPEKKPDYLPAMQRAADRLADPRTLAYAAQVYGAHGVSRMRDGEGHAYLGYVNLGLSMLRAIEPATRHAALNDRITDELALRVFAAPTGMTETYPGETWPPDVAAVVGSIGLHARATGRDRSAELEAWATRFSKCAVHVSGYLVQRSRSGTCIPLDAPRGSGTAVGAYFLSFAHRGLSSRLATAVVGMGRRSLFGFGAIREYADGFEGKGDGNAGPIVLGVSVGATGFGIGAARAHGHADSFVELARTASLFGVSVSPGDERGFAIGGALGNALLLAMLTARPG
jgi:hypothetical protein